MTDAERLARAGFTPLEGFKPDEAADAVKPAWARKRDGGAGRMVVYKQAPGDLRLLPNCPFATGDQCHNRYYERASAAVSAARHWENRRVDLRGYPVDDTPGWPS